MPPTISTGTILEILVFCLVLFITFTGFGTTVIAALIGFAMYFNKKISANRDKLFEVREEIVELKGDHPTWPQCMEERTKCQTSLKNELVAIRSSVDALKDLLVGFGNRVTTLESQVKALEGQIRTLVNGHQSRRKEDE